MQILFDSVLWTNKSSSEKNQKKYIMLHHTGNPSYGGNIRLLSGEKTTGRNVSVHYVVGLGGRIAKIGEHEQILWHAGISKYEELSDLNKYSIGIEICSDGKHFTYRQRVAARELVEYIMEKEDIPHQNIIRHMDVAPRRKVDVGDNFWNAEFDTFEEYKASFDHADVKSLLENIVRNQKQIWIRSDENSRILASNSADRVRIAQELLGLPISK